MIYFYSCVDCSVEGHPPFFTEPGYGGSLACTGVHTRVEERVQEEQQVTGYLNKIYSIIIKINF
jgi:hypothetical protein